MAVIRFQAVDLTLVRPCFFLLGTVSGKVTLIVCRPDRSETCWVLLSPESAATLRAPCREALASTQCKRGVDCRCLLGTQEQDLQLSPGFFTCTAPPPDLTANSCPPFRALPPSDPLPLCALDPKQLGAGQDLPALGRRRALSHVARSPRLGRHGKR